MHIRRIGAAIARRTLPPSALDKLQGWVERPSRARRESNAWLLRECAGIAGNVLSIGSGRDSDAQGGVYRDYFPGAASYTTSEHTPELNPDLVLDVRNMPEVKDASYDCVFCSGVLEHVDDYQRSMVEMTRILKPGGILLLGVPFRQAIHLAPTDFWRFTEFGIRKLLADSYRIVSLSAIDSSVPDFPAAYWVKAVKN